jgi:glycogen debranching enzyme
LRRGARVTIETSSGEVEYSTFRKRLQFHIELRPHETWSCSVRLAPQIEARNCQPRRCDNGMASKSAHDGERDAFLKKAAELQLSTPPLAFVVQRAFAQARRDLANFRLYDLDRDGGWTFAAGLPVYIAFFGRDTLISSWEASTLGTEMLRGSLAYLAETQATERDDWRDAEPGKFVHQMETGPVAMLDYNVNARYYGSITGPGFYPIALSDLFHWTGDKSLLDRYLDAARKGLAWLDREARRNDGFYQYQKRSEQGVKNQAWKDSYDAIVYPDGALVKDPIAPAELQAFVFAAKVRMSELLWWLGKKEDSRKFFQEAITLRDRYNETYWMEDEGCYGMGLDGSGRLIRSLGSESAHALASGIVPRERVDRVVDRMFRDDMFSGWGIRTLSSAHKAYNPFSYHRGSVWPAEQVAFAMGLMRYGLHEKLHRLARSFFEAASVFEYYRLPELFAGHPRDERHPVPALYPEADSPQAWSSAAVPCMVQALVGLFPYAPLDSLFVDPHLPEWLPEFTLTNIRVGNASADLRFHRKPDGSSDYELLDVRGKLHIVHQPSPWSLTADSAERASDLLQSLVNG